MPKDINQRLEQLRVRRHGTDRVDQINETARNQIILDSFSAEPWEKRAVDQPNTRYALGAMQEVSATYTRVSLETAARVEGQLEKALTDLGFSVQFRLQGSVPLNIHIRGVSDVDLLVLDNRFFTYDPRGLKSGTYLPSSDSSANVIYRLRYRSEAILEDKFPKATVDKNGSKAIKISGGSLARPVDVVPSHWYNTMMYQQTLDETYRGVVILDKDAWETHENFPFLHISKIDEMDRSVLGTLKKAIRLCKNVKSDADREINLSSFDITSAMYHANKSALLKGYTYELGVLAEVQRHLDDLATRPEYAKSLRVPDGSRAIFDTPAKITALTQLSVEVDDLFEAVVKEQVGKGLGSPSIPYIGDRRQLLFERYITG